MAREHTITARQPDFMREAEARILKAQVDAENLSDADIAKLAEDIVAYFSTLDKANPMTAEEKRDLVEQLSKNRSGLISLGTTIQLFGSTALWLSLGNSSIVQGNVEYSILFAAQSVMQASRVFGMMSGESGQKLMARMRGMTQRAILGEKIPELKVSSPAVAEVLKEKQDLGAYLVQHREQVMIEGMLFAQALGMVGWTPLILQGDGYAATAAASTAFSLIFTTLMVGQTYHRNYMVEGKPEPTRFGDILPNQKAFSWIADNVVEPMPANVRGWAELTGFMLSCISVPAIMMQGINSGDYAQAASALVITAGLFAARLGYMIPPSQKVVGPEDTKQFRDAWNQLLDRYADAMLVKFEKHHPDLRAAHVQWTTRGTLPADVKRDLDAITECGKEMRKTVMDKMKFLPEVDRVRLAEQTQAKFDHLVYELFPQRRM